MLSRRDFLQVAAATASLSSLPQNLVHAAARQTISQESLLEFDTLGQVTLLHFTDMHAQIVPLYFREPSENLGVGYNHGLPPHITGEAFLKHFGLNQSSPEAHALSSVDFSALAKSYGRIGGLDRMATLVNAIRADRPNNTLLLDGGDTWQGSYTSLKSLGSDMVEVMNALKVDAMTAHWEFTYGTQRVKELAEQLNFPFLAGNVIDTEWEEPVFQATQHFQRGGIKIAVIGQAFPYTPVANPRYLIDDLSFGIREEQVQKNVNAAREQGAELVVLLSHNGFDVDRKMASRVKGIDIILTGHTHDAIPVSIKVDATLLVASGSHGKFLSRMDVKMSAGKMVDFRYKLIPIFSDVIHPDKEISTLVNKIRAPHKQELERVLGHTESLLYRRGNFNGTFDDLICQALIKERDAEISLSPGFRWGATLLPGQPITVEDVYSQTAITYPKAYRLEMSGKQLKEILEDVADNLFNPDPYYQQGGDMVRVGGMGYRIDIKKPIGSRISEMTMLGSGKRVDATAQYVVAGWASVNPQTQGPAIYDLLSNFIEAQKVVNIQPNTAVNVIV